MKTPPTEAQMQYEAERVTTVVNSLLSDNAARLNGDSETLLLAKEEIHAALQRAYAQGRADAGNVPEGFALVKIGCSIDMQQAIVKSLRFDVNGKIDWASVRDGWLEAFEILKKTCAPPEVKS